MTFKNEAMNMAGKSGKDGQAAPPGPPEMGTKERVLDASIELFAQRGFDAVSMQEIAEAVGIKKASLYYHFTSKDQILESVLGYPMARLGEIPPQGMATEENIAAWGVEKFMLASRDVVLAWMEAPYVEKVLRIIFVEMYHNDQIKSFFTSFTDMAMKFWESNFSIMAKHGLIRPVDPKVLAEAYLMIFSQAWMEYFLRRYGEGAGSFRQQYTDHIDRHTMFLVGLIKA